MSTNPKQYAYRITWSDDNQAYVGTCAEFPSLSWLADTQANALSRITKVVAGVLEDMVNTREAIPEPLSLLI